jgi:hypothetical protein
MGLNCGKESILKRIEDKNIPETTFKFMNSDYHILTMYCQICGKKRFDEDDIKIMNNNKLEKKDFDKFKNKYEKELVCPNMYICKALRCEIELFILVGQYPYIQIDYNNLKK